MVCISSGRNAAECHWHSDLDGFDSPLYPPNSKSTPKGWIYYLVEPRGIEPLSESNLERVSPGAVCYLHSLIPAGTNTLRELVASLFMVRAKLSAHTVSTQITPEPGSWTFRGGWAPNQAAIATELLSDKFKKLPVLSWPGATARYSSLTTPVETSTAPSGLGGLHPRGKKCVFVRTARRDQAASWAPDRFPRGCLR